MFSALSIKWSIKYHSINLSITEFFPRSVNNPVQFTASVQKREYENADIWTLHLFEKGKKKETTAVQLNKIYLQSHSFGIIILPRHFLDIPSGKYF